MTMWCEFSHGNFHLETEFVPKGNKTRLVGRVYLERQKLTLPPKPSLALASILQSQGPIHVSGVAQAIFPKEMEQFFDNQNFLIGMSAIRRTTQAVYRLRKALSAIRVDEVHSGHDLIQSVVPDFNSANRFKPANGNTISVHYRFRGDLVFALNG